MAIYIPLIHTRPSSEAKNALKRELSPIASPPQDLTPSSLSSGPTDNCRMARHGLISILLLTLVVTSFEARQLEELSALDAVTQTKSSIKFNVGVNGGAGGWVRKSLVAANELTGAIYTVAQVDKGTVQVDGTSLDARQQSMFVYKMDAVNKAQWAVNLQAQSPAPTGEQAFAITGAAVDPANDNLMIVGTYTDTLTIESTTFSSSGSYEIFAAYIAAEDGSVIWAKSFGGAAGADSAYDVTFDVDGTSAYVSGIFSSEAFFSNAISSPADTAGVFVASVVPRSGAVAWVTHVPVTDGRASSITTVKVASTKRELGSGVVVAAAANGPVEFSFDDNLKVPIAANAAGAVVYRLTSRGAIDSAAQPTAITSSSNGVPTFALSSLQANGQSVMLSATYNGAVKVGNQAAAPIAITTDTASNGVVIALHASNLQPKWQTSLEGVGGQTADALASINIGGASVFVAGVAAPGANLDVKSMPAGATLAIPGAPQGMAYLAQLSSDDGTLRWVHRYPADSSLESSVTSMAIKSIKKPELVLTGLLDRNAKCISLSADGSKQSCGEGDRMFFVGSAYVDAEDTAQSTNIGGSSDDSLSLSGGAIAGIVIGCIAVVGMVAAGVVVYRRKQESSDVVFAAGYTESMARSSPQDGGISGGPGTSSIFNSVFNPFR